MHAGAPFGARRACRRSFNAAHPAEAQRLRSEVDTLHARLGQLDTVKVRCLLPCRELPQGGVATLACVQTTTRPAPWSQCSRSGKMRVQTLQHW